MSAGERKPTSDLFEGDAVPVVNIEHAQVLMLRPTDILVVHVPRDCPHDMYSKVKDQVASMLKNANIAVAQIAIVPDDTRFSVLRPDFT